MNKSRVAFALSAFVLASSLIGCNQTEEAVTQTAPPGVPAQTQAGQDTGLASPRRELKDRANAAAQSTESPVGAPKANMQ